MEIVIKTLKEKLENVQSNISTLKSQMKEGFDEYLQNSEMYQALSEKKPNYYVTGGWSGNWSSDSNITVHYGDVNIVFNKQSSDSNNVVRFSKYCSSEFKVNFDEDVKTNKDRLFRFYTLHSDIDNLMELFNQYDIFGTYESELIELQNEELQLEKSIRELVLNQKSEQINRWLNGVDEVVISKSIDVEKEWVTDYDSDDDFEEKISKVFFKEEERYPFSAKCKTEDDKGHCENRVRRISNITKISKGRYSADTMSFGVFHKDTIFTETNLIELLGEIYDWNTKDVFGEIDKKICHTFDFYRPIEYKNCKLNHTNIELYVDYDYEEYKNPNE